MKLAILGGGGFRVPLVYAAVLGQRVARGIREVALHDTDVTRLGAIGHVLAEQAQRHTAGSGEPAPARVTTTTSLDSALEGADFVFSAIRVGGLEGRVVDERLALGLGLLGQETTGAGGVGYGLRTVPVALAVAERVALLAPDAWVINFTNPAGLVTQAMQTVLGERVVGICDSPLGLAKRAAGALGLSLGDVVIDYAGVNHLGWLHGLSAGGRNVLPELLADRHRLEGFEEGHLFGAEWLQSIGAIPNEYLWYYDFTRDAIARIRESAQTRGEFLLGQQSDFYAAVEAAPARALEIWDAVRRERNATYMAETRAGGDGDDGPERTEADIEGGGYEGVALALMGAIARDDPATLILNVRNRGTVPGLPDDAVVEVPCLVTAAGPVTLPVSPLRGRELGLVQQVKAVDELVVRACREGSAAVAVQALASHPLVDSVSVARELWSGYRERLAPFYAGFR
ncbi:6-phospho-beta-glucosidase [Intrasporangium sp. DVR]|uniref:family 4 glycosyl hydrolase n=1 Tax=Intrasporangium sp. DVR TaxID=3127867 RepID=UPI00313A6D1F